MILFSFVSVFLSVNFDQALGCNSLQALCSIVNTSFVGFIGE